MRRRRLGLLLIPLAVGLWFLRSPISERTLAIHFGASGPSLREVDLVFQRDQSVVREVTLHFPHGAPADVSRGVRLPPGEYEIGVRIVRAGGDELHVTRALHTDDREVVD